VIAAAIGCDNGDTTPDWSRMITQPKLAPYGASELFADHRAMRPIPAGVVPQLFWSRRMRRNLTVLFVAALLINVGMWLERFEIIVVSLSRDFLPSAWHSFLPTWVDLGILAGTLGLFGLLFLGFLRLVPFVPVAELKQLRGERAREDAQP